MKPLKPQTTRINKVKQHIMHELNKPLEVYTGLKSTPHFLKPIKANTLNNTTKEETNELN